jgi:hypothetical protein
VDASAGAGLDDEGGDRVTKETGEQFIRAEQTLEEGTRMRTDVVVGYKWLTAERVTTYQSIKWPKPAKQWTQSELPVLCRSGWHLATFEGISEHVRVGAVLWLAEGRGARDEQHDKIAFESARLIRPLATLGHTTAVRWAADCATRVLPLYEAKYAGDDRPRKAIEAARRWAKNPTDANYAYAASAASDAASDAAYAAYSDAASSDAAYAAYSDAAYAASYAADAAYDAASYAAAAANAAYAASYAAASYAAATSAKERLKEREWQTRRLLKLMGVEL